MAKEYRDIQAQKNGWYKLTDEELWSVIKGKYDAWLEATQSQRRQWRMNMLFARGVQWAIFDPRGRPVQPRPPTGTVRITKNLIKPFLLDVEAKFDIRNPTFDVVPNTTAEDDKDAAIAGENSGQHYWRALKIRKQWRQIVRHCEHMGSCLGVLDWDETIGPQYVRELPGVLGPNGSPAKIEHESDGDLTLDLYSAFRYFTDEYAGEIDAKYWLGLVGWMTIDAQRERWEEAKNARPELHSEAFDDTLEDVIQSGKRTRTGHEEPGSSVLKFYVKPQRAAEEGLIIVAANNVIYERDKWPRAFEGLTGFPAVKFDWYLAPEQFRGISPIEDQIPIQREINITASQVTMNKNACAVLKILSPTGSGVNNWTDVAGQIIQHTPGLEPKYLQPPNFPAYVFKHSADMELGLEDIQMYHKPSKGKVPSGVKSGVGINLLQEQDDRPLSVVEADMHEQLSLLFRKILQVISVAVSNERMLRFVGPNKRNQVIAFKGADLRQNSSIHLSIVGGATKSKAGVLQTFLEMLRVGAFRDERGMPDVTKIKEMQRYAIPEMLYEDEDKTEELARSENDMLYDASASIPMAMEWEDHIAHLKVLEEEMNTMSWKRKAREDQEIAQRFIHHRMGHLQLLAGTGQLPQPEPGGERPKGEKVPPPPGPAQGAQPPRGQPIGAGT